MLTTAELLRNSTRNHPDFGLLAAELLRPVHLDIVEYSARSQPTLRGAMEPKIEQTSDGRVLMVMRTQLGAVFKSYSSEGGRTWPLAQTTGLSAPESCPALLRIPQTRDLLLVWNHSAYNPKFYHYGVRSPLTVAISQDDGCGDLWL